MLIRFSVLGLAAMVSSGAAGAVFSFERVLTHNASAFDDYPSQFSAMNDSRGWVSFIDAVAPYSFQTAYAGLTPNVPYSPFSPLPTPPAGFVYSGGTQNQPRAYRNDGTIVGGMRFILEHNSRRFNNYTPDYAYIQRPASRGGSVVVDANAFFDINAAGVAVGEGRLFQPVTYSDSLGLRNLPSTGGTFARALNITDDGVVWGVSVFGSTIFSVRWNPDGSVVRGAAVAPATRTDWISDLISVNDSGKYFFRGFINNRGDMAKWYISGRPSYDSTSWYVGAGENQSVDLQGEVLDINENGDVLVGLFAGLGIYRRLDVVVPEPSGVALLALPALALRRSRR